MSRLGKSLKLVITFDNPTHAFAFESACKKEISLADYCLYLWSLQVVVALVGLVK